MGGAWTLLVPLKPLGDAKSRLRGALPGVSHDDLVLALALDTVAAAVNCPSVREVLVVTTDPVAAAAVSALGAVVRPDPGGGLNGALARTAATLPPGTRAAALTADLPALRPADLAAVLDPHATGRWFVPDLAGTGTTLLAAATGDLRPRFGPGSAAAHARGDAVAVPAAGAGLRCDVDTPVDLWTAAALGTGPHTRSLLHTAGGPPGRGARQPVKYGVPMQGTVAAYDADTRSGSVLLDDGKEIVFSSMAFDASGLRLLRFGQRVRVEVDQGGTVTRINIPTLD